MYSAIRSLKNHPKANARVFILDNGDIKLVSYMTDVITLTHDGWLSCSGTYSNTTRRHIGLFMKEYVKFSDGSCGDYRLAKLTYECHVRYNILTGEIENL